MSSRVVAVGLGALAAVGFAACGSAGGGTGAAPASTFKLGTPNYQTLLPQVTSTVPPPTNPGDAVGGIVPGEQSYTVQSGDVMVTIAKKFCRTAQELVDYNAWQDGFNHPLFPGNIVKIPANSCKEGSSNTVAPATADAGATAGATPAATSTTSPLQAGPTYTVQAGDYLGGIAAKVGTTVEAIVQANGWADGSSHPIFPGQKIKVPAKTG